MDKELNIVSYEKQRDSWPKSGKHILAQYDSDSVVVYQAYKPSIGQFAAKNGYFGGEFSLARMSWIKPNFLWMMYRSGWASKEGQEIVLAVWLSQNGFIEILRSAVHSSFKKDVYETEESWSQRLRESEVRLQWDPDHDPIGNPQDRRAIQLGLKGQTLKKYSKEWILKIEDITDFVIEQRENLKANEELLTPKESVFTLNDPAIRTHLQLDVSD